jgi:acyl dehydratase
MVVHGEQSVELHGPLPVAGTVESVTTITGIYDKGSAAVVVTASTATDTATRQPLWTTTSSLFIRGEGGWGGDRGPSSPPGVPDRDPDHTTTYSTRPDQALIYRLSGDRNPLHADPKFAAMGGFDRPILHGLCTFGFTGRALLHTLCGSDPDRFGSMAARFSKPVYPGEDLTVAMWVTGENSAMFRTTAGGGVVIDAGRLEFRG